MPSTFSRQMGTPFIGPGPSKSPSQFTSELTFRQQIHYLITGQTLNYAGTPLGGCNVSVFQSIGGNPPEDGQMGRFVGSTVSDSNGNYSVEVQADPNMTFQAVAYLPGSPDVAGVTVNTLVPTVNPTVIYTPIKSFVLKQKAIRYFVQGAGTVNITPTAGNTLIAYAVNQDHSTTLSISDGVNTWVQQQQLTGSTASLVLATALNVAGTSLTISVTGGSSVPTICVFEYSGITRFESSAGAAASTSPVALNLSTNSTDGFFCVWGNETNFTIPTTSLTPINVGGNQTSFDPAQYASSWDFLNTNGIGYALGNYTLTITASGSVNYVAAISFQ